MRRVSKILQAPPVGAYCGEMQVVLSWGFSEGVDLAEVATKVFRNGPSVKGFRNYTKQHL
jgi:hypothetical protein